MSGEKSCKKPRLDGVGTRENFYDGPIEEEAVAKQMLEEAGFTEGNFTREEATVMYACSDDDTFWDVTPFMYFCSKADYTMCRYLLSKGASATNITDDGSFSAMRVAARAGKLEMCQWLHRNGVATYDGANSFGLTSLGLTLFSGNDITAAAKWLILNGGLVSDSSGEIDVESMRRNLEPDRRAGAKEVRPLLLSWAESAVNSHTSFMAFLSGTISIPEYSPVAMLKAVSSGFGSEAAAKLLLDNSSEDLLQLVWIAKYSNSIQCLRGTSGVLELIADYYGLVRGKDLRTFRQLVPALTSFLEDYPLQ